MTNEQIDAMGAGEEMDRLVTREHTLTTSAPNAIMQMAARRKA